METISAEDVGIGVDLFPALSPLTFSLYDSFLSSHCSSCFSLLPPTRRTISTAPSSTILPPSLLRTYPRFSQPPTSEQLSVSSTPSPPPPPPPLCRTGSAAFSPTTTASWPILPSPSLSDAPPVSSPPFWGLTGKTPCWRKRLYALC